MDSKTAQTTQTSPAADRWTRAGLVCVITAGATLGFAAWTGLGELVGITETAKLPGLGWTLRLAWLLQIAIEGYALIAIRIWWVDQTASPKTKVYAAQQAVAAVVAGFLGQSLYHLARQCTWTDGQWWWVAVVLVTGSPAVMIALSIDLLVRLQRDRQTGSVQADQTTPVAPARPDLPSDWTTTDQPKEDRASQTAPRPEVTPPSLGSDQNQTGPEDQPSQSAEQTARVADLAAHRKQSKASPRPKTRPGQSRDYDAIWAQMLTDYQTGDLPTKRGLMARYGITNGAKAQELYTRLRLERQPAADQPAAAGNDR